jgi:hypothetical protein
MSEEMYYQKYLKYKEKYLRLRNEMEGGDKFTDFFKRKSEEEKKLIQNKKELKKIIDK